MGTSIFFAEEDSAMNWTTLNFGKHRGKTLPQIIFDDADWFFNGWENGYFKNSLAFEAREIYRRARSIRTPEKYGRRMLVEYTIHKPDGKFGMMSLIPDTPGLEHLRVSSVIDFYVPRLCFGHDKTGYRNFVSNLKTILFGKKSYRMNKQAREDFFSDDSNFVLN
jgi:hypothetical protein